MYKEILKRFRTLFLMCLTLVSIGMTSYATTTSDQVIKELEKRSAPIDIVLAIVLFIEVIAVGFEFIINRKLADKRGETLSGIPWLIGGTAFIAFGIQITRMILS